MKIVSIVSSGRKNGNTERIVKLVEKELHKTGIQKNQQIEIEHINLNDYNIRSCRGCRVCFDKGEELCPLKDDCLNLRDKINEADGVILASPVYVEDVNGVMKNWIDRMAFNCHRPEFAGKSALLITSSGVGSSNHSLNTMKSALTTWGFRISGQYKFRAGALSTENEIVSRYNEKIKSAALELYNSLLDYKVKGPTLYSLLAFKVQQKYWKRTDEKDTFDYKYWNSKGWLEDNRTYYTDHNANIFKVKFAGFTANIVSKFFI